VRKSIVSPSLRVAASVAAIVLASAPLAKAPLRTADEALARITAVLERPVRTDDQRQRNLSTAVTMLERFRAEYQEPVNQAAAAFLMAQCLLGLGRTDDALAEVENALSGPLEATYRPAAYYVRGRVLLELGRPADAIPSLRRAIRLRPEDPVVPEARLALARVLADEGQGQEAVAQLDTIVAGRRPPWAIEAAQMMLPGLRMIGRPAPTFVAHGLDGGRVSLEEYRGRVVLLDFWATWCGPCRDAMPSTQATYDRYHSQGFDIIGISLDEERGALEEFVRRFNIGWRQAFDGGSWETPVARLYDVTGIPKAFLLDRQGRVAGVDLQGSQLEAAIQRLLSRK